MVMIGYLLSVVMAAGHKAKERAYQTQTHLLLVTAKAIAAEYEVQTGAPVDPVNNVPIDWSKAKSKNVHFPKGPKSALIDEPGMDDAARRHQEYSFERFAWAVSQHHSTNIMLRSLGAGYLKDVDGNGFLEVRDRFGRQAPKKIVYAAKVSHSDDNPADDFLPQYARPFFASAGPDGKWGHAKKLHDLRQQRKKLLEQLRPLRTRIEQGRSLTRALRQRLKQLEAQSAEHAREADALAEALKDNLYSFRLQP